ncbi:MAG: winged helix-turn-helix domain-containing protein [Rubrivivax sp.]
MSREPQDPPSAGPVAPFTVGRWRVDPAIDAVALDGRVCKLEPRTMRLLTTLAARPGEVLGSQELLDAVWPGVIVTGQSLYQAVAALRAVLKADAATGEFIANVPRKGYRLVAPVTRSPAPETAAPASLRAAAVRTVAVLPFRDLGVAAGLSFLPEALLAGLIQELSRQPDLTPIARGTMLSYAGRQVPPRTIADELGVRYVLDGTITQAGDDLLIGCEFVDAASDSVLASESIELPAQRWPVLAQRVTGRLARAARLQLSEHAARIADAAPTDDPSALELAMCAWVELYGRPQNRETNDRAWRFAREALRRDEAVGAAWNALAFCEWRAAQYGWPDGGGGAAGRGWAPLLADAVAHAQRATSLAPSDPDGYYTLGLATHTSGEPARAEANLRHCIGISASYAPAYGLLGLVRAVRGHPQETAALCERAFALSPREPLRVVWHWTEAFAASLLGQEERALERALLGIAANPDHPACYVVAAVASLRLGRAADAARYADALRRSSFSSIERLRHRLPPMRVEPWASAFLADLQAAGLPER